MVGDPVTADVQGAERAGIKGILVRREDERAARRCPDLRGVIKTVEDVGGDG
ncbi:MAG: HAD hydrolase-like protein [Chloroflexi bacterium]|nr:HAD hydrolase-like protein [Chloroflexota bacterium]